MKIVFYEGHRIYFRPIELEDEAQFRVWLNDPRNWRTLERRRPLTKTEETEWLKSIHTSPNDVVFGVVVRENDRLIGSVGLHRIDWISRKATFGIQIGNVEYQNREYGTGATKLAVRYGFDVLNLHRIELDVYAHNERAIRSYEKAGFFLEGRLREAAYVNGRYVDILRYSIMEQEWRYRGVTAKETEEACAVCV